MSTNPSMALDVLTICALGMDERARQTLAVFFERQLNGRCLLAREDAADVALIDADGYQAADLIAQQRSQHPDRPLVLLSLKPENFTNPGSVAVQKPVRSDVFSEILQKLGHELRTRRNPQRFSAPGAMRAAHLGDSTQRSDEDKLRSADKTAAGLGERERHFYIGSMPDIDFSNSDDLAKIFYEPSDFLQGHLRRAIEDGLTNASVVRMSSSLFGHVTIHPFARRAVVSADDAALLAASRIPVEARQVQIELLPNAAQLPANDADALPLEHLCWQLALLASRGRLPKGTDLDSPVILKHWPNLTRLLLPPHTPRILGLWSRKAYSLKATARILGVPQRCVFGIFSACAAQGLVVTSQRAADRLVEPELPKPNDKRNLFSMLLKKLSIGVD